MKIRNERINMHTLCLIWLIVSIGCLYVFHMYVIGKYTVCFYDVGTDGKDQYIMWYNGIVNSLRDGNFSAWDFRNGFGMNTMGHHLTEPFLIPVYILGYFFGPEHITWYMVWVEIIRILISATVFYWYISEFDFTEKSKLLVTVIYSFNAYMMVWGQHYALGSSVVYFPVILMFAERVIRKRKFGIGLCVICCITMLSSFYQGYMCMFGGGAYVCIRILMQEKMEMNKRLQAFAISAGSMILGVLMSAFRFFPSAAAQVGSSARMDAKASLFERLFVLKPWSVGINKTILYRLFSSCIQGNGNETYVGQKNFYEDPNLFFSTLFIILLLQYLVLIPKLKESKRSRFMQYLVVLLCACSVLVTNITTLFNGLYAPFFRHTFVLMPAFGVMCAKVLDHIFREKKISIPALAAAGLGMTAIYMKAYQILPEQQFKDNAMILWMTGLAMIFLLFCLCKDRWLDARSCYLLLTAVVTVNVVSDSYLCYNHRVALPKDHAEYYSETYHSDVDAALDWIEENDPTFYRVEKDYFTASSCFDSLAQDYRGISAYNSNQNADIKEFVKQIWPELNHERDVNHIQFQNAIWDHTLAALTDVKYVLSKSEDMNLDGYTKINQIGSVSIYQNDSTDSLGKFFTKALTEEQFEANKESLNTSELLKEALIVPSDLTSDQDLNPEMMDDSEIMTYQKEEISDILTEEVPDDYEGTLSADGSSKSFEIVLKLDKNRLSEYKDVIFQFTITAEERTVMDVSLNEGYTHSFVQNWKEAREIHIEIPQDTETIRLTVKDPSGYLKVNHLSFYGTKEEHDFSEDAKIVVESPKKDSLLTGHISAAEDGYVMLAVPCESGWSVYLNGEKQDIFDGDYGFIAFYVKAGEYDLEARFDAPLLKLGIGVSVICTVLFVILVWITVKKKKEYSNDRF